MTTAAVILDTNVFVAAGFKRHSASARILDQIRTGEVRMIWSEQTRNETRHILNKIPPLSWDSVASLFLEEDRYQGLTVPEAFECIPDADDRKFAALADVTGAVLITNDDHLLSCRDQVQLEILTPGEYCSRQLK